MFEIFRSVEIVWTVWLVALVVLAVVFGRLHDLLKAAKPIRWRRFHADERGTTYSLSFIMVLPFLVLILAVILETSNLLISKAGTMYAAQAAARSAVVWSTVNHANEAFREINQSDLTAEKAEKAAVIALTPFASGLQTTRETDSEASDYLDAYKDYVALEQAQKKIADNYIKKKYTYAKRNVRLALEYGDGNAKEPWLRDIQATLTFDAPFVLPFIGRILGGKAKNGQVVYEISSVAALQNECPRNETGHLGIRAVPGL